MGDVWVYEYISYSGYFSWGETFGVFMVVKETTNIFLTKFITNGNHTH